LSLVRAVAGSAHPRSKKEIDSFLPHTAHRRTGEPWQGKAWIDSKILDRIAQIPPWRTAKKTSAIHLMQACSTESRMKLNRLSTGAGGFD
jgi:hypothetical protein